MLDDQQLREFSLGMQRARYSPGDATIAHLKAYFTDIFEHPDYAEWLEEGQFAGAMHDSGRFYVPPAVEIRNLDARRVCERFGVTRDSKLMVKIDRHFGQIHLTDGFWADPSARTFPTVDESEHLCGYIKTAGYDTLYELLIDPACGCGHHAMALPLPYRASMDVSSRAINYCTINSIMADDDGGHLIVVNNLYKGIPTFFSRFLSGSVLVVVNMPFAILPRFKSSSSVLAQDGGARGLTMTLTALRAIAGFWEKACSLSELRAVVLFYSLGKSRDGPWEIESSASELFGPNAFETHILVGETMWRVNGRKTESNPMPIESLELKAMCRFTWPADEEDSVRHAYRNRQAEFRKDGWTHLGYGLLDIRLTR